MLLVLNVLTIKHAQTKNVLILVQTPVEQTLNVESIITVQYATVWTVIPEIHFQDVILNHVRFLPKHSSKSFNILFILDQLPYYLPNKIFIVTHAVHHLVVHFLNAVTLTDLHLAHVCRHTLVHLQIVVQNALLIQNARAIKLASTRNVEILVLVLVDLMPIA